MRVTGAFEAIVVRANTLEEAQSKIVDWLAKRGIPLPDFWSYVEPGR